MVFLKSEHATGELYSGTRAELSVQTFFILMLARIISDLI